MDQGALYSLVRQGHELGWQCPTRIFKQNKRNWLRSSASQSRINVSIQKSAEANRDNKDKDDRVKDVESDSVACDPIPIKPVNHEVYVKEHQHINAKHSEQRT